IWLVTLAEWFLRHRHVSRSVIGREWESFHALGGQGGAADATLFRHAVRALEQPRINAEENDFYSPVGSPSATLLFHGGSPDSFYIGRESCGEGVHTFGVAVACD